MKLDDETKALLDKEANLSAGRMGTRVSWIIADDTYLSVSYYWPSRIRTGFGARFKRGFSEERLRTFLHKAEENCRERHERYYARHAYDIERIPA